MSAGAPLAGLRVVEMSRTLAGAYAGKLFADCGARVTLIEPAGGHPLRNGSKALFSFLSSHKRTAGEDSAEELIGRADILIRELDEPGDGPTAPVTVEISPWGRGGPWSGRGRPWTDFTLQAESGSLRLRGLPDSYPLMAGGRPAEWVAGALAASGALAAVTGAGTARLDVALLDVHTYVTNLFVDAGAALREETREPAVMRHRLSPSVEPVSDGWVGFNLASAQNLQDFMVLVERPDLLEDEELSTHYGRYRRAEEWNEIVRSWTRRHSLRDVLERTALFRIPSSPVHNGATVVQDEHMVERGFFITGGTGTPRPDVPFLIDGRRPRPDEAAAASEPARPRTRTGTGRPLTGLRVLDLGTWWAGSFAATLLGSLGADVLKVESTRRVDGARLLQGDPRRESWWERGPFFLGANHNKRSITLDLTDPEGLELLERLIADADVLLENFAPRVLDDLGLGWPRVHALNPTLVMLRMPAFGLTGPLRDRVGYAQTVEQYAGLCWVTGYPDGPPTNPNGPADPMGGANAVFALLAALRRRAETGQGLLVEAPLVEAALTMAAEQVLEAGATGCVIGRDGNRSPGVAPQGAYPCSGTECWVAISVVTDEHWAALRDLADVPRWREDPALGTYAGRKAQEDELDRELAEWTRDRDAAELVSALLARGVPAAELTDPRFVHEHPQLAARGLFEEIEHPVAGRVALPVVPYRHSGIDRWSVLPPPTLGQHNHEVLEEELALPPRRLRELAARGVIGTRPDHL
ncbi:CaiB/BaiF CoA-transferase family protein [Actinomadura kijaniata]|uniref:CaiB/BaiF CoA-transferase family protein n=1 Tax=Actinomadura kijaniata TaxID=46161 RepID=UPI00082ECB68|nr:CoA transferase [Actinomadura kijaniata]